jgi:hypothetical protein
MQRAVLYSSQWKVCVEREFVFMSGIVNIRGSIFVVLNEEVCLMYLWPCARDTLVLEHWQSGGPA